MNIKGINHVTVLVSEKDRAREFYTNVLGLEPINVGKSLWMKAGNQFIHVSKNSGNPVSGTFYHFAIEVDDSKTYIHDLIQKGVEVFDLDSNLQKVKVNTDLENKTRQFFVNDPDGNIVEIIYTNNQFFKGVTV